MFCRIRQTRLYFGPYNSMKRLVLSLASNISLDLRRLTCMLDTLVWSRGGRLRDRWLWWLLLSGLRKFRLLPVKAGMAESWVEWTGLTCLHWEMRRSSQYSAKLRDIVRRTRDSFSMDSNKREYFDNIVSIAHQNINFKSIQAKIGYKTIQN